jgi:hypothetical protein
MMFNLINTKILVITVLLLASIAGSLAYRNAKDAENEAAAARSRAAIQQAMKTSPNNWGGSADTIRHYRPK